MLFFIFFFLTLVQLSEKTATQAQPSPYSRSHLHPQGKQAFCPPSIYALQNVAGHVLSIRGMLTWNKEHLQAACGDGTCYIHLAKHSLAMILHLVAFTTLKLCPESVSGRLSRQSSSGSLFDHSELMEGWTKQPLCFQCNHKSVPLLRPGCCWTHLPSTWCTPISLPLTSAPAPLVCNK